MLVPLGGVQLVANQRIGRLGIRHAQQRLGQAHEHDAFLGVEAVLLQQGIDTIAGIVTLAYIFDQPGRTLRQGRHIFWLGQRLQLGDISSFVYRVVVADNLEKVIRGAGKEITLQSLTGFEHLFCSVDACATCRDKLR